jgi:hypothetical protein
VRTVLGFRLPLTNWCRSTECREAIHRTFLRAAGTEQSPVLRVADGVAALEYRSPGGLCQHAAQPVPIRRFGQIDMPAGNAA